MKNLVIDYGNTAAKVGIFRKHELLEEYVFFSDGELRDFVKNVDASAVLFSSVGKTEAELLANAAHIPVRLILSHMLPLPIVNRYATPETLGVDRLAGVCGAKELFPGYACLVIDCGTCITYDFIDNNNHYLGGGISPGVTMRLKAMHEFTAKLPLAETNKDAPLIGNSTLTSLQSGAFNGTLAEIEGMILRYQQQTPQLRVILCGGDTHLFENSLKGAIFAVQNLVLKGLNSILLYNVSH